mgnify:CR=1 FL=1
MSLTYRLFQEADLDAVLELWEHHSGWGGITRQQYHEWYVDTPYEPCISVIAENEEGQVVGQGMFIPSRLFTDGKEIRSVRISAPIFHKDYRQSLLSGRNHPTVGMFLYSLETIRQMGYELTYVFPAAGWVPFLQRFPALGLGTWNLASYPCYELPLTAPETYSETLDPTLDVRLVTQFGPEYDQLWEEAVGHYPIQCGTIRRKEWLQWKLGGHLNLEVRNKATEELIGYLSVKKQGGLIVDALARTSADLRTIYQTAIQSVHHRNPDRLPLPFDTLKGMLTADAERALAPIPYERVESYTFAFGTYLLDETGVNPAPDQWYLMPDD